MPFLPLTLPGDLLQHMRPSHDLPPPPTAYRRVTEAFDRADAAIEAWRLNTVPEGDENDEDEDDDTADVADNTFITGGWVGVVVCMFVCGGGETCLGGYRFEFDYIADMADNTFITGGGDRRRGGAVALSYHRGVSGGLGEEGSGRKAIGRLPLLV